MMSVVVVDLDAARLAALFEPARSAAEVGEHRTGLPLLDTRELERGERARGVPPVVLAGNRKWSAVRIEVLSSDDLRNGVEPPLEQLRDLRTGGKRRVMVEVDVRDDRDPRSQRRDRAIGFISFGDEPAPTGAGVAAQLWHVAADQPGGIAAEPIEAERDHPARGRLAVRPGNHDRLAQRHELCK